MIAKPTSTREKILKSATQLFWEKSYASVSVDMICKATGLQKGSFYHFFPSKEGLAITILETLWQQHKDHFLIPTFNPATAPLERFARLLNLLSDAACKMKRESGYFYGCPFGNLANELSTQSDAIRLKLEEIFSEYTRLFQANLDEAVARGDLPAYTSTRYLAQLFISSIQGGVLMAKTNNDPTLLRFVFANLLELVAVYSKTASKNPSEVEYA
jgi:TetR/AcrR family transcriptional repressor of nem operon